MQVLPFQRAHLAFESHVLAGSAPHCSVPSKKMTRLEWNLGLVESYASFDKIFNRIKISNLCQTTIVGALLSCTLLQINISYKQVYILTIDYCPVRAQA